MTIFRQLALASALIAAPAAAQGFEDLDVLEARLVAALGAGIGETGGPTTGLDRRIKLAACPEPAIVEAPRLGAATIRCEPLGWRIRVPLVRGPSIQQAKAEPVIHRGDQVELLAAARGFTVSTIAIAEQDGAPGDRIRVRSDPRKPPVIVEVTAEGRVALPGFN